MSTRSFRYSSMSLHTPKSIVASTDRDAWAFLEAATIYNANQQKAIIQLVRGLKRTGLWSKMKAIYPFVGGTATTHKWNLKDPRDLDAAFRLTFFGGWTHSSTGADPNGTTGYARTYLTPSNNLSANSAHLSYYSREEYTTTDIKVMIGVMNTGNIKRSLVYNGGYTIYANINDTYAGTADWVTYTDTSNKAFYLSNRPDASTLQGWRNGIKKGTRVENDDGRATNDVYLGTSAIDTGAGNFWSDHQCAFATIGDGLTDTDATNLYNIVDLYQKRLGRAV